MKLEPGLCHVSTSEHWFNGQRILISILSHPPIIIVILSLLLGLGWHYWPGKFPSGAHICLMLPLILYVFLLSPIGIALGEKGLTAWVSTETANSADAIIILGRGPKLRADRVDQAFNLWEAKRAPFIVVSGRNDAPIMTQSLVQKGIPENLIDFDHCSSTTEENAKFTQKHLSKKCVKSIILVTDPTHMLRARLTFQSLGFQVWPHMSDINQQLPRGEAFARNLREYLGLITYALRGRF